MFLSCESIDSFILAFSSVKFFISFWPFCLSFVKLAIIFLSSSNCVVAVLMFLSCKFMDSFISAFSSDKFPIVFLLVSFSFVKLATMAIYICLFSSIFFVASSLSPLRLSIVFSFFSSSSAFDFHSLSSFVSRAFSSLSAAFSLSSISCKPLANLVLLSSSFVVCSYAVVRRRQASLDFLRRSTHIDTNSFSVFLFTSNDCFGSSTRCEISEAVKALKKVPSVNLVQRRPSCKRKVAILSPAHSS